MNFVKRALLSVWKHKVKTIILIFIFTLITTIIFSGISIESSVTNAKNDEEKKLGKTVLVESDAKKAMKYPIQISNYNFDNYQIEGLPEDLIKKLSEIKHVQSYNIVNYYTGKARNFTVYTKEKDNKYYSDQLKEYATNPNVMYMCYRRWRINTDLKTEEELGPNIYCTGAIDTSKLEEFTGSGNIYVHYGYNLVQGRHLNKNDLGKSVAIISQDVANKNKIKLGDKIQISYPYILNKPDELKVVGIFKVPTPQPYDFGYFEQDGRDTVFVPYTEVQKLQRDEFKYGPIKQNGGLNGKDGAQILQSYYYIDSFDNIGYFNSCASKMLNSNYKMVSFDKQYKVMVKPFNNIIIYLKRIVGFTLSIMFIILCLVIILSQKNRTREFGMLLAVGEKRHKVIAQIFIEVLIPLCIAFCITIFIGPIVSNQVGNKLLSKEVKSEIQNGTINQNDSLPNVELICPLPMSELFQDKEILPIDTIKITPITSDYPKVGLLCFLLAFISVCIPCGVIYRYKPKKMLTNI